MKHIQRVEKNIDSEKIIDSGKKHTDIVEKLQRLWRKKIQIVEVNMYSGKNTEKNNRDSKKYIVRRKKGE